MQETFLVQIILIFLWGLAHHINNHKEKHFGHSFLLAKGNGAGGTDEAGGPDGPAGADQPGEL